jgi:hypothetical protein
MSEKKVVSRGVAIGLGIICIILGVGLVGAMAYYAMNSANTASNDYVSTHSHSNADYDAMWTPKLISVNLQGSDNRPFFGTPYLLVSGYVVNVHMNWAYNCKLHVVAYQSGGVTAVDTYISLGTIAGESSTQVSSNVYYSGSSLSSWTITPQWTATP